MGFTREELARFEGATVDDLLGASVHLLIVGINPGLWTAATNTHFCHPTNRFYPALKAAGVIDWDLDADVGMTPVQRADLVARGIGITNLVARATARADQLADEELRSGRERLLQLAAEASPKLVAVAGITAFRTAFGRPRAVVGPQEERIGQSPLWVIPNPSGLNAHVTLADMAAWFSRLAGESGIL